MQEFHDQHPERRRALSDGPDPRRRSLSVHQGSFQDRPASHQCALLKRPSPGSESFFSPRSTMLPSTSRHRNRYIRSVHLPTFHIRWKAGELTIKVMVEGRERARAVRVENRMASSSLPSGALRWSRRVTGEQPSSGSSHQERWSSSTQARTGAEPDAVQAALRAPGAGPDGRQSGSHTETLGRGQAGTA